MGGRLFMGLTDATLCAARRPMGSDQGFSSRPRRPWGRHGGRQPIIHQSDSVSISSRIPWRDLPERFGDWKIVHQRFSRWAKSGVFERIFKQLAIDNDNEYMMIDATIVRA